MKKIFVLVFIAFLSFSLTSNTLASTLPSLTEMPGSLSGLPLYGGDIIYQDDEITVTSFGNDPDVAKMISNQSNVQSVTGPGGKAVINAASNGRAVYWTIRPATLWPYYFRGSIKLQYYSGYKRTASIVGGGLAGSSSSGVVYMKRNNGGYATLKGTAYATTGSKYTVLPGVGTSF